MGVRIYPGTELHVIALERGKITRETDLRQPIFYRNSAISREEMERIVLEQARGRMNWLVGAGGEAAAKTVARMHARGRVGPLWEYLAR